ncbi:MAG: hypothetical protein H7A47_12010 [Verrucomicrobiales bacterium]|nr:hypothetical protein [Verrucomicrobiales bacterium]
MHVEGKLVLTSFTPDGKPQQLLTNRFDALLERGAWSITTHFATNLFETYAWDGKNTYGLLWDGTPSGRSLDSPAIIRRGAYPLDGHAITRVAWVAFVPTVCGRECLDDLVFVPWGVAGSEGARSCRVAASFTENGLLLQELLFRNSLELWQKELQFKNLEPKRHPSIFRDGETVGVYNTLTSTNVFGFTIPTHFRMQRFALAAKGKSKGVMESIEGSATSVTRSAVGVTLPSLTKATSVFDFRFGDDAQEFLNIRYRLTNAIAGWRPMSDPELVAAAAEARMDYPAFFASLYPGERPVWTVKKAIGLGFVSAALLFPIIIFLRHRMVTRTRQKGAIQPQNITTQ